jgi:hypothetical protein
MLDCLFPAVVQKLRDQILAHHVPYGALLLGESHQKFSVNHATGKLGLRPRQCGWKWVVGKIVRNVDLSHVGLLCSGAGLAACAFPRNSYSPILLQTRDRNVSSLLETFRSKYLPIPCLRFYAVIARC